MFSTLARENAGLSFENVLERVLILQKHKSENLESVGKLVVIYDPGIYQLLIGTFRKVSDELFPDLIEFRESKEAPDQL